MAETERSTSATGSLITPPMSPRRPSLDDIAPGVEERKERYMKLASKAVGPRHIGSTDEEYENANLFNRESETYTSPSPISNFSYSEAKDRKASSNGSDIGKEDDFDYEMLPGETDDEYMIRLKNHKNLLRKNKKSFKLTKSKARSKSRSRSRKAHKHQQLVAFEDHAEQHLQVSEGFQKDLLEFFQMYEKEIYTLQQKLSKTKDSLNVSKEHLKKEKKLNETTQIKYKEASSQFNELQDIASDAMAEKSRLETMIKNHEQEKQILNKSISQKDSENKSSRQKVHELEQEVAKIKTRCDDLRKEKSESELEVKTLKEEVNDLLKVKEINIEKSEKILECNEKVSYLEKEIKQLREDLNDSRATVEKLKSAEKVLDHNFEEFKEKSATEDQSKSSKLSLLEKDLQIRDNQLDSIAREKSRVDNELEKCRESMEELKKKESESNENIAKLKEKLSLLEELTNAQRTALQEKTEKNVSFDANAIKLKSEKNGSDDFEELSHEEQLLRKVEMLEKNNLNLIKQINDSRVSQAQWEKLLDKNSSNHSSRRKKSTSKSGSASNLLPLLVVVGGFFLILVRLGSLSSIEVVHDASDL